MLFGQPELDETLRQPQLRPLRERITHSFRLDPFGAGEIREYLMFRMRTAGYRGPDLFTEAVVKQVARASLGLTRRVNLIADKALLAAFAENTHTIRPKHVEVAVRDSEFSHEPGPPTRPRFLWGAAVFAAGALLGIGVYMVLGPGIERPSRLPDATVSAAPVVGPATRGDMQPMPTPHLEPQASEFTKKSAVAVRSDPAPAPKAATSPPPTVAPGGEALAAQRTAVTDATAPVVPDVLESRLAATEKWLATENGNLYIIQLLGTVDATQLKLHLNDLSKSTEMNKLFVYRTLANGRPLLTVLYGTFSDRRSAQVVLDKLPEDLKANRPFLRTVEGVRDELRRKEVS